MLKPRNELDDQVTLASSRDTDPAASLPGQTAADAASPTQLITVSVTGAADALPRSYEPMPVGGGFATYVAAFGPLYFGNDAAQFSDQAFSPDGSLAPIALRSGANSLANALLMAPSWAQALAAMDIPAPTPVSSTTQGGTSGLLTTGGPSGFNKSALATTQPRQFVFTSGPQGVFGSNTSFTFSLPSFLYQHYAFGFGASFAGFGLHAGASITGGIKGSVSLSLGQFTPDYPVTINPGVAPYVQSGPNQFFSIDPSLVSTNDAQFSLSLPQANANLDFGLQAQAGVKLSFPSIRIGVTLPFVGFEGYTVSIPSQFLGFNAGKIYSLPSNTSISIPGDGTVTLSELQSKVLNSTPQSAYGALPTLELSGNTDPFFVANTDLVSILAQEIPDPFAALQGSESFYGIAGLSYKLLSLPLSGSLWLNEDVKITPVRIMETVTDTLSGETHSGPLGSRFNFAAPTSGSGIIPLTVSFGLDLKVTTTLSLDGNIKLTLEGPSVSASILGVSAGIGPLGNFNLLDLSGTLFGLYSKSFYETLTTTGTVDVQTFATPVIKTVKGKSSAVLLTKPGTDLVVTSTGTITGAIYGVETGTLSAALITDYGLITATGNGVVLQEGGTVDVQTGGRITGSGSAAGYGIVLLGNTYDAVVNQGAITGFSGGVYSVGGSLKNEAGARITATKLGVSIANPAASVVNNGYIQATTAVSLAQGGSLYNAQSGTITGSTYGLYSKGVKNGIYTYDPVSVENQGKLTGGVAAIRALAGGTVTNLAGAYIHGGSVGVTLSAGWRSTVSLTNAEGATISGGSVGVYLGGKNQNSWYTTLVDYGTISGGVAAAELYGLNRNTLVLGPDARLSGGVRLSNAFNTVTLAAGNGDVGHLNLSDLTLVGTKQTYAFQNGRITFAPGANWVVSGNIQGDYFSGLNAADRFDDTAIAFSAGERAVVYAHTNSLGYKNYWLSVRAAGNPQVSLGAIYFTGPINYAPIVTAGASGGVDISFGAQKLTTVSVNHGEVDISPGSFFDSAVTINAGVVVSNGYYGGGASQHYGVNATGERATLTNFGTVTTSYGTAVDFHDGGLVVNEAGAIINGIVQLGARGSNANNTITFINAGTVTSSTGVSLGFAGTVTNTGLIDCPTFNGIYLTAASGTVFNQGTITAGRSAVRMLYGGFVYNETGGLLTCHGKYFFGVEVTGGSGTVINGGTISSQAVSVFLADGGLVVNESGAITGSSMGVSIAGAAGDIANAALISGIRLANGGTIINSTSGIVTAAGGFGVNFTNSSGAVAAYLHNMGRIDGVLAFGNDRVVNDGTIDGVGIVAGAAGGVTITNSGVISGSGGTAVKFTSASDRLIAEAGSQFIGALVGGGGVLELAGSGAESISGLGGAGQLSGAVSAAFAGFGSYVIDSGVAVTLTGLSVIAQGKTLIGNGAVTIGAGSTLQAYGVVEIGGSLNVGGAVVGLPGVNAPGGAGGQGVELLAGGVVTLSGAIRGGAGMNGNRANAQGDAGGVAIAGPSSGTITSNFGAIAGGNGGASYYYLGVGGAGGAGVSLGSGSVTNNGGTISGGSGGSGVSFYDRGGYGGAGAAGVILTGGGTVTNNGGAISGGVGGAGGAGGYYGGPGGAGGAGVVLGGAGTVINVGGTISGGAGGGGGSGGTAGGPGGAAGDGVVLAAGGVVINGSAAVPSALISGVRGVYAGSGGAATVTNFGTIRGLAGTAVQFNSTGDRLIAEVGSTWLGVVNGGGGALELAGGTGTITGLGGAATLSGAEAMTFSGFGSYAIDAGSSWTLAGGHALGAGKTLTNAGTLSGFLSLTAASDRLVLSSGSIVNGRVAGGGGVLELRGGAGTIKGLGTSGTLTGASAMTFSGFGSYVIDAGGSWILAGGHSLAASQTLTNAGTLSGALALTAASDRLIVASGSIVNGSATGGGGVLELAGGNGAINGLGGTGTLSGGAAMTFSGFGSYVIDAGGAWSVSGTNKLASTQTLTAAGAVINNGAIIAAGAAGLDLTAGGSLDNAAVTSLISGIIGVYADATGAATLTNFGTIKGAGGTAVQFKSSGDRLIVESGSHFTGVVKGGGGTLELAGGTGTITGLGGTGKLSGAEATTFSGFGAYAIDSGASWTLTGANTLAGNQILAVSGSLINSGTLTPANATGVELLAGGSLINNGAINGTGATGVDMATGGSVNNAAAGLISGVIGVLANAGSAATVTSFGTIRGAGGTAVQFNSVADRLVAEAGSTWIGAVKGGGGALELATGSGTISGLGGAATLSGAEAMTFSGFGSYLIDAGTNWTLTGGSTVAANQTLTNAGTLTGPLALTAASARLIEGSGSVVIGSVAGGGGSLELTGVGGTITGLGATGTLSGAAAMTFSGFGTYDIDAGAAWTLTGANLLGTGQTLVVAGGLTNNGTIGAGATAVDLSAGGSLINASAASLISGAIGIYAGVGSAATVTNFGAIDGTAGVAVKFVSASDRLIVEAGASFVGAVQGGGGTLELASGVGSIGELGSAFSGFGSYVVDAGGVWTVYGGNFLTGGHSLIVDGAVSLSATGAIEGSTGDAGGYGAQGGNGGAALILSSASAGLNNAGAITGGQAGPGGDAVYAGQGGTGGVGVLLAVAGASVGNGGTITGGGGGRGGYTPDLGGGGGGGGTGGAGVWMATAGSLTNIGAITGGAGGLAPASPAYSGHGGRGGAGVSVTAGGLITNNGGMIAGGAGGNAVSGYFYGGGGGFGGAGVAMSAGGTLVNGSGAILGGAAGMPGVSPGGGLGPAGIAGDGVDLVAGGVVVNGAVGSTAALISGLVGVYAGSGGAATVTNWGTINGSGGVSVQFKSASDRLIAEAGSTWVGSAQGGGGTLELAGGSGAITGLGAIGTVSGAEAMTFSGFGGYQIDTTAHWALDGVNALATGQSLAVNGTLNLAGTLSNAGTIRGGAGVAGGYGATGGAGVTALTLLSASASLSNTGAIAGGQGGQGGMGGIGVYAGFGGTGGAGVVITTAGASIGNGGTIVGGAGGQGGAAPDHGGGWGGNGGAGVWLAAAGVLTNSGAIVGGAGGNAVYTPYSGNGGQGGAGVSVTAGGLITNNGGTVTGGAGGSAVYGYFYGGRGGTGGAGVALSAGGTVVNGSGAILGGAAGLPGAQYGGGHGPAGIAGDGVAVTAGGVVINGSTSSTAALIEGLIGVYAGSGGAATVTSWGTIEGTGGVSVQFRSASDRLIAEAGSTWVGSVQGGGGTLELAGGTGTITGLGATGTISVAEAMTFSGFGTYQLDAGGSWTVTGTNALAAGDNLLVGGTLTIAGTVTSAGTITGQAGSKLTLKKADIIGGTLQSATTVSVSGTGNILDGTTATLTNQASLSVANKGALTIQGAIANSGKISLAGKTAATSLIIGKAGATLSGHGSIVLGASAFNTLTGAATTATLTNVDNTISGSGLIGAARLVLVNQAAGVIDQTGTVALTINTGTKTITNAGTIEATGSGGATIASAIANTGLLEAVKGNLTVSAAVTGTGSAVINAGTMTFASAFAENVNFSGSSGVLVLAQSQGYTGTITGFSKTGGTSLDLRDIGFVSASEATFSGTTKGGVLTVTDGTHTAKINLTGNYTTSTWTCSSDGAGGVIVIDPTPPQAPSPNAFTTAMAGLGAGAASAQASALLAEAIRPTLLVPRGA